MNNELANPLQSIIEAAAKTAASTKTTGLIQRHTARHSQAGNTRFILADISGSMDESAGTETKFAMLRRALQHQTIDWNINRLVAFHSFPEEIASPAQLPSPTGGTALHLALDYIAAHNPAYTLVISDGHPDNAAAALKAADKVSGRIDVLYIGPDGDLDAIRFMYQLAGRAGGTVTIRDIKKEKTLPASTISGLLCA